MLRFGPGGVGGATATAALLLTLDFDYYLTVHLSVCFCSSRDGRDGTATGLAGHRHREVHEAGWDGAGRCG